MAGSLTVTYGETRTMRRVTFDWTSDASSADVSGTKTKELSGIIERVTFIPDSGDTQPTNEYDVTLEDENGVDVLGGNGADLSNAAASTVVPGVAFTDGVTTSVAKVAIDDQLELKVENAGNSNGGTVVLYLR